MIETDKSETWYDLRYETVYNFEVIGEQSTQHESVLFTRIHVVYLIL